MGWEIKTLQKTKETLKHDVEKLEKEIITLESQKKSVMEKKIFFLFLNFFSLFFQIEDANAMITRENKELRATIEELNDQNRIVLQNYHNHVKNVKKIFLKKKSFFYYFNFQYAIHEGLMSKLYDSMAQLEKENSQLKEKVYNIFSQMKLSLVDYVDYFIVSF